jgi:fermentation-respiration switch protein FrsA (DUF1100 family)
VSTLRILAAFLVLFSGIGFFLKWWYGLDLGAITPERAISQVAPRPILLIHGTADTRIPVENAYRLKAATTDAGVELWIVPGAEHVASYATEPEAYAVRALAFFERSLPLPGAVTGSSTNEVGT